MTTRKPRHAKQVKAAPRAALVSSTIISEAAKRCLSGTIAPSVAPPPEPVATKTGRILIHAVCGADIPSRLIAWYGQGYGGFSHIDIQRPDGTLAGARSDHVGGQEPGFRIRPPDYEKWCRIALIAIACTPEQQAKSEVWIRDHVGAKYDRNAILGFLLGRRMHGKGQWICSAAAKAILLDAGLAHPGGVSDSQITPDTIVELAIAGLGGEVIKRVGW